MAGRYVREIEIKAKTDQAEKKVQNIQELVDELKKHEYKVSIGVDSQKLEKVIGSLEKMLDSLGKGTGDFKQFENLSKELTDIASDVQNLSKAFGKVDDSGTKTLLSSIQSIDKSLSDLSQHILNVNENFESVGKNASDNVGQINGAKKATEGLTDATKDLAKAQDSIKSDKSLIDSSSTVSEVNKIKQTVKASSIFKDLIDVSDVKNGSDALNAALTSSMNNLKALYDSGKTESLEYYASLYKIIEIQKKMWQFNGMGKKSSFDASPNVKDAAERMKIQDSIFADFKQYGNVASEVIDFVIGEFSRLKNAGEGIFKENGKLISKETLIGSMDLLFDESYVENLKRQEQQALATAEAEQKLVNVEQQSSNSSLTENQDKIQQELKETEQIAEQTAEALEKVNSNGNKSNISSGNTNQSSTADSFEKVSENAKKANEAAKEFVFKPNTEGFDDVIKKFSVIEELAKQITKITKTTANDGTISYNAKLKDGSNYYLGESSNPQVLKANEVVYDAKAINSAYEEATKINNALNETNSKIETLSKHPELSSQFTDVEEKVNNLNNQLKQGDISLDVYNKSIKKIISNYESLVKIQQNRDVEAYKANAKVAEQEAKAINSAYEEATKINNALNETNSATKSLSVPESLKEEFEYLLKQITELQTKLKSGEISIPDYNKLTGSLISNYSIEEKKTQSDVNSALKQQESAWKNIQSIREKIATANPNDTEYISLLKNAKKYYQEQYLEAQKVLKANQDLYNVEAQRNKLRQITLETDARITNNQNLEQNKKAYQELNSAIQQYSEVSKRISNGKALDGDIELAQKLEDKILNLQKSPILSPSQIEESERKLVKLFDQLDAIEKKTNSSNISGIDESIKKYQEALQKFSIVPEADNRFASWQLQLDELSTKIVELQNLKANVRYDNNGIANQDDINQINKLTAEIDKLILKMKDVPNTMRGWNSLSASKTAEKINDLLKNNTRMSEDARLKIKAYYDEIKNGNPSAPLNEILDKCIRIVQEERAMGRAGKSFFDIFKTKAFYGLISQMQSYLSMYVGFYGMMRYIRSAIKTITELDTALVDLKKTTSMTGSQLEDFYYDSNRVAKQMGVTTKEIIDQASAWSRLNRIGLLYGDI